MLYESIYLTFLFEDKALMFILLVYPDKTGLHILLLLDEGFGV
jgi:hypothetical protein